MNPETDLLSQLRDIQSAPQVPWWPPAPGWWVLAALLMVALYFLVRSLQQRYRVHQRRKQLLGFIDLLGQVVDPASAPQEYLSGINRIFKIVAIRAFPEAACAHMQGQEWADFLQQKLVQKPGQPGDFETLEVLSRGPYQPFVTFDAASLVAVARRWVQAYG